MALTAALAGTIIPCLLCVIVVHAEEDHVGKQVTQEIASVGREMRKFGGIMLPLLLGISARLAAIIPTAFLGTIGIFIFVALAKKAFVISVMSFMMAYMDKRRHMKPKIMHIHHHPSLHESSSSHHHHDHHEFDNFNFDSTPPVYYSYDNSVHYPHRKRKKWPKIDEGQWSLTGPQSNIGPYMGQPVVPQNTYLPQTTVRHPSAYVARMTTLDSYLPQSQRESYLSQRRTDDSLPPFLYSPQNIYYPQFLWNATETPLLPNSSISVTPQLEQFVKNRDEEDPR